MKTGQVEKQLMFLVIAAAIIIVFILILKGYSALVKGGFFEQIYGKGGFK